MVKCCRSDTGLEKATWLLLSALGSLLRGSTAILHSSGITQAFRGRWGGPDSWSSSQMKSSILVNHYWRVSVAHQRLFNIIFLLPSAHFLGTHSVVYPGAQCVIQTGLEWKGTVLPYHLSDEKQTPPSIAEYCLSSWGISHNVGLDYFLWVSYHLVREINF